MDYSLMETPFKLVHFYEMNKKQAKEYFEWFMQIKEERIAQLEAYARQEKKELILDKSPDSLVPLWEWFQEHIEWEEMTEEEIRQELASRPEWMHPHILADTKKMSILTLALAMDISIYFGETLIHNNPSIYWGHKSSPKQLDGVNRPILLGFKGELCVFPYTLIKVCTSKSSEKKNSMQLYDLYNKWSSYV